MRSSEANQLNLKIVTPQRQARIVFDRMDRYIVRLSKSLEPANVHRFRTNSRRVEVLIERLAPESRHKKKTLKLLSRLRKRAGKLRDLDVHAEFLKSLKLSERQNQRTQLLEAIAQEHARRSRKLAKAADTDTLKELRKRLRREEALVNLDGVNPVRLAISSLPRTNQIVLNEKSLHACRIAAKHARYLAELGGETAEAKFVIDELKQAQDAIGEWHDILKLKQRAEKLFGGASQSPLVAMLQNLSRARFRTATNTLAHALSKLNQVALPAPPERKPAASQDVAKMAAA